MQTPLQQNETKPRWGFTCKQRTEKLLLGVAEEREEQQEGVREREREGHRRDPSLEWMIDWWNLRTENFNIYSQAGNYGNYNVEAINYLINYFLKIY